MRLIHQELSTAVNYHVLKGDYTFGEGDYTLQNGEISVAVEKKITQNFTTPSGYQTKAQTTLRRARMRPVWTCFVDEHEEHALM